LLSENHFTDDPPVRKKEKMKKTIFILIIAITLLTTGIIITSCKSTDQKEGIVPDTVLETKQHKQDVKNDANTEVQKVAGKEE
jgi:hypothetical protein